MISRGTSVASGMLFMLLLANLALGLPSAHAQSLVVVSMPSGAYLPAGAPGYSPATVTVVVGVNNTVTWTNNDTAPHTVTPGEQPAGASWSVGSGNMNPKAFYSFTFTVPGTYSYACAYHGWMTGTVIVKAAAATSTTTTTSTASSTSTASTTNSVRTTTTPEFPAAWLYLILFATVAAAALAAGRVRTPPVARWS